MAGLSGETIVGMIKTHKGKSAYERKDWDKWRSWYLSEYQQQQQPRPQGAGTGGDTAGAEDDQDLALETNYPYAYIDTMIANVCPQNPQMTIGARREDVKESALFREALINANFRRQNVHEALWKLAQHTAICGRGFLKTTWNFRRGRPEHHVIDPRQVFFDMSASKWEDIRYLIEAVPMTREEFNKRTKRVKGKKGMRYNGKVAKQADFGAYPGWLQDKVRERSMVNEASKIVYEWVVVYEVYDFVGDQYYHVLEGIDEPLFKGELPYRYIRNPFNMLTFNDNLTDLGGLSDVKLIAPIQERLNELDTLELWHAQSSIPILLVNAGLVDNAETAITALSKATYPNSMVRLKGRANAPMRDLIGQTPVTQLSPSFALMRERCIQIIEFVLGIPAYSRGAVGQTDVATEVALADTATRTRNGRRVKKVLDIVSELARKTMGLYEEFLPAKTELPLRLTGSPEVMIASRKELKLRDQQKARGEEPLNYDYDPVPYSPTENHRLVQLQQLGKYMEVLMMSPVVDKNKLFVKLLDLLMLREVQTAAPQAGQQPPVGVEGESPQDTAATGALPPGIEPPGIPTPAGGPGFPASGFAGAAQGFEGSGIPGITGG